MSPISTLPPQILGEVFNYVCQTSTSSSFEDAFHEDLDQLARMVRICKWWRDVFIFYFDHTRNRQLTLQVAVKNGCIQTVEKLLRNLTVDPTAHEYLAIHVAYAYEHKQILKLLIQHPKMQRALLNPSSLNLALDKHNQEVPRR